MNKDRMNGCALLTYDVNFPGGELKNQNAIFFGYDSRPMIGEIHEIFYRDWLGENLGDNIDADPVVLFDGFKDFPWKHTRYSHNDFQFIWPNLKVFVSRNTCWVRIYTVTISRKNGKGSKGLFALVTPPTGKITRESEEKIADRKMLMGMIKKKRVPHVAIAEKKIKEIKGLYEYHKREAEKNKAELIKEENNLKKLRNK